MKRVHISIDKTSGEPFPGFVVFYVIPTITIAYYKSLRESNDLYFELTWLVWILRVQIDIR